MAPELLPFTLLADPVAEGARELEKSIPPPPKDIDLANKLQAMCDGLSYAEAEARTRGVLYTLQLPSKAINGIDYSFATLALRSASDVIHLTDENVGHAALAIAEKARQFDDAVQNGPSPCDESLNRMHMLASGVSCDEQVANVKGMLAFVKGTSNLIHSVQEGTPTHFFCL